MRILLTGGSGQLGFELRRSLALYGKLWAPGREVLDLSRPELLMQPVLEFAPDLIVNAAAYTAVDRAEAEPELAERVNAEAPAELARLAERLGATLLHFSTDYVFDGTGTAPYRESDVTRPLSVYGRTKRDGELAVMNDCSRHYVLRTSWVYGSVGGNFVKTILRLAAQRDTLNVVHDQVGAPTSAMLIADVSAQLVARLREGRVLPYGLYHLAAAGETSWHGFAREIVGLVQDVGGGLVLRPEAIQAIPAVDYPAAAARPANSRLDTHKLRAALGIVLPDWRHHLQLVLQQLAIQKG
ncbi:dTDP-4-dehydrorhamnose reductase [Pseudogulbenkiania subflava]|uniref:dTDP-4-dehydrorhamnose reductase n=1 Tax=Pseudogulbenkiania subflava DSM 22618 TaxID=1123014 RepID=A0A1Y6BS18_9NEIS|nr:dTDP-4-dehydrorhamnose reductase [Pseudogulbenkiania subflava]SMF25145.1 dTDP-4-dehydrorhamnose reductase [Pseudogulbenkiania subflava DSM 22618]